MPLKNAQAMANRIIKHLKKNEAVDPRMPYHSTRLQLDISDDMNRVISAAEFSAGVDVLTESGQIIVTKARDGYGQLSLLS